jgi:hypothetical protein
MSSTGEPPLNERLRWDDGLTTARSNREFLRNPVRVAFTIGALIMFVGALLPWAEGFVGFLPVRFGGFDGASDGLILATLAIVALLFARVPDFLDAPDGARRFAPLILGLVCVGLWLLGWQAAQITIQHWEADDGHGAMVIGYWVAGLGVLIVAVVGAYASLRYHPGQTSNPIGFLRKPRRSDAATIGAWIGGLAGLVGGALAATQIFSPTQLSAPMLFMATIGLALGGYLGRAIGGLIA